MSNSNFKLDGNTPTVSWADPKSTSDHSAAAQVYTKAISIAILLEKEESKFPLIKAWSVL